MAGLLGALAFIARGLGGGAVLWAMFKTIVELVSGNFLNAAVWFVAGIGVAWFATLLANGFQMAAMNSMVARALRDNGAAGTDRSGSDLGSGSDQEIDSGREADGEGPKDLSDLMARMQGRADDREREGAAIAEQLFNEKIKRGEAVYLSEVLAEIEERFDYDATSRSTGFMRRMKAYVDDGDVVSVSAGPNDSVFVHEDHLDAFINKLSKK